MKKNIAIKLILFFAILGIAVSSYALFHHYEFTTGEFCSIGDALDCDKVNRSDYSEIFGIPVALFGVVFYFSVFILVALKIIENNSPLFLRRTILRDDIFGEIIFYLPAVGLLFTFYLTFIEAFIIKSFCPICLMSFAAVLGIFIAAFRTVQKY